MNENFVFQRRNRLKKHFVNTSNVLLYCYEALSDASKITFQVIDGFDWEDHETGESKGYVYPAVETLANIRKTSARTIQRHILELIEAKLLTRLRRRNKSSVLYIEEVSEIEINKYFDVIKPKDEANKSRNDKNVVSHKAPETTKMSFAYSNKKDEKKENEINVNEDLKKRKGNGMMSLQGIMKQYDIEKHTLPKNKVKSLQSMPKKRDKRDYYAQEIANTLGDQKSLGCYRVIAEKVPETVIFQALANIKEIWKEGKIKQSRGALFVDIMKQYAQNRGLDLGFS